MNPPATNAKGWNCIEPVDGEDEVGVGSEANEVGSEANEVGSEANEAVKRFLV